MYEYRCKILRVVDGDTVHVSVDLGLETYRTLKVRLAAINAPELSEPSGQNAKSFLTSLISEHPPEYWWTIRTVKDRTEKYGRYLGHIINPSTGESLNQLMVDSGHAGSI